VRMAVRKGRLSAKRVAAAADEGFAKAATSRAIRIALIPRSSHSARVARFPKPQALKIQRIRLGRKAGALSGAVRDPCNKHSKKNQVWNNHSKCSECGARRHPRGTAIDPRPTTV
jgi:hypothetical protein